MFNASNPSSDHVLDSLVAMHKNNPLVIQCAANTREIRDSPYYSLGTIDQFIFTNMGIVSTASQQDSQTVTSCSTQEIRNNLFLMVEDCKQCKESRHFDSFVVVRGKVNESSNNRLCIVNIDRLYRLDKYDIKLYNVMSRVCGKSVTSLLPYQIKASLYPAEMEKTMGDSEESVKTFNPGDCIYGNSLKYIFNRVSCYHTNWGWPNSNIVKYKQFTH